MNVAQCDMDESAEIKKIAISKAKEFLDTTEINEAEVSKQIKQFFDNKYEPNWHCIVGKNFYSSISHEAKTFIFFYHGQIAVLLYKLG